MVDSSFLWYNNPRNKSLNSFLNENCLNNYIFLLNSTDSLVFFQRKCIIIIYERRDMYESRKNRKIYSRTS